MLFAASINSALGRAGLLLVLAASVFGALAVLADRGSLPFSAPEAAAIMLGLCEALHFAHDQKLRVVRHQHQLVRAC